MCINIYTLIKSTCCKSFMTTFLLFFNAFQICGKIPWFFCWLPFAWLTERLITIDRLTTRWPWINFYKSQNLTTTNKKNTDIKNNNLSLIKCSFYYKSSSGRNSAYCIMWYVRIKVANLTTSFILLLAIFMVTKLKGGQWSHIFFMSKLAVWNNACIYDIPAELVAA